MKLVKKIWLILFCLSAFFCSNPTVSSHGKTIWCNPDNKKVEDGLTKSSGYTTLRLAFKQMNPGDTLVIANGNWSNSSLPMSILGMNGGAYLPPSGTGLKNMTTICAESDWSVFLPNIGDLGVGRKYVCLKGLVFLKGAHLWGWNNCKLIRCGFRGVKDPGNTTSFSLSNSKDTLLEECIAWGGGRYKFLDYLGRRNIFRRCVARHDWYITERKGMNQESNFRGYAIKNCSWQNCISIDSNRLEYQTRTSTEDADFWVGDQNNAGGCIIEGCIAMRGFFQGFYLNGPRGQGDTNTVKLVNSIALGPSLEGARFKTGPITYGAITATVKNCAFVNFNKGKQHFINHLKESGNLTLTNSIVRDVGSMLQKVKADYNCYFNTGSGRFGRHSVEEDPFKNGFLYPCRIEPGSNLQKLGEGGNICGPTIMKKIGVSGTHYGEKGWDKVTEENLWPFPNEKKIRALFRNTVAGVSGIYGFCKDGQTLSNYIWAYFGNTVPPFNVQATPGDGTVSLTWDPPADVAIGTRTGFNVYNTTDGIRALMGGTLEKETYSKRISGLTNGKTYEFATTAIDKIKGESGLSYKVRATPKKVEKSMAPLKTLAKKEFINKLGMTFVLIPPGSFEMGIPLNKKGKENNSMPHQVTLTKGFYMQTMEVTQRQWKEVMDGNPSFFKECGNDCPVEQVSWQKVQQFIKYLNRMEDTNKYRLPTEAEWEYACRAGTKTPFSFGKCLTTEQSNYNGDRPFDTCQKGQYRKKPISVKGFPPNAWGLCSMHGNVWEWCEDWLGEYPVNTVTDPLGPPTGSFRIIRGGGWNSYANACRSGNRGGSDPTKWFANLGFRVVREP